MVCAICGLTRLDWCYWYRFYRDLREERYLDDAEVLVRDVDRVLGRRRGIRIGEAPDRDGQYFHYLAMWLYALSSLSEHIPQYRARAIALARDVHRPFVLPEKGVVWKMKEDLSGPYPGFGYGALDAFNGYVVYRILGEQALASEIMEMQELIERDYQGLQIDQDLGLGMMLWLTHFFPQEGWAKIQASRSLAMLDRMWVDPPGYFCRAPRLQHIMFAFTRITASHLACRQWDALQIGSLGSTNILRIIARGITMIRTRSPTSWRAPLIFRVRFCGQGAVSVCQFKGQMGRCRASPQALLLQTA